MIKLIKGRAQRFYWLAPGLVSGSPSLTVRLPAGDYTAILAPVATARGVTGLSSDGAEVRLSGSVSSVLRGLVGERYGAARLNLGVEGVYAVEVARIEGGRAQLVAPVPARCSVPSGSTLEWALYSVEIPAAQLAAVARNVEWSVEWVRQDGADAPEQTEVDSGELHVVRVAFATGLNGHNVLNVHPSLRPIGLPSGFTSWQPLVDQALERMAPAIEARAAQARAGAVLDDLRGSAFQVAHGLYCAAVALENRALAGAYSQEAVDVALERAEALLDQIFRGPVWIDADGDGQADDGEVQAQAAPSVVGGAFSDDTVFGVNGTLDRFGVGDDR